MLGLLADIETDAGNLLLAREHAADCADLGEQQDDLTVRMYGLLGGGTVCALLGDLDDAERLARAGQELALSPVLEPWLAWGDHTLGLVALDRGDPTTALEHFDRSERRNDAAGFLDPVSRQLPNGIEALIGLGRLEDAAARIAEYEARCWIERHVRVLALVARCSGLVASLRDEHERAESDFERSLELQLLAPSPYERARTLMTLATARRRRRRRGDARHALEEAAVLLRALRSRDLGRPSTHRHRCARAPARSGRRADADGGSRRSRRSRGRRRIAKPQARSSSPSGRSSSICATSTASSTFVLAASSRPSSPAPAHCGLKS